MKIIVLLINLLFACFSIGCNSFQSEKIVLKKGFEGYVFIVFDQNNGIEPEYHDNSRVYRIPQNGILLTKFSQEKGLYSLPSFYYDKILETPALEYVTEPDDIPENQSVAFGGSHGVISHQGFSLRYEVFYVGNKKQISESYREAENFDLLSYVQDFKADAAPAGASGK